MVRQLFNPLEFENRTEKLRFYLVVAYACSLPLHLFYSNVIILAILLTTLIDINLAKLKQLRIHSLLLQAFFIIGLCWFSMSFNKGEAKFLLERQLNIFILPIILPLSFNITKEKTNRLLLFFSISCAVYVFFLFANLYQYIVYKMQLPFFITAFSGVFFNHNFTKPLGIHAGYMALYVAFSILFLIYFLLENKSNRNNLIVLSGFIIILLIGFIFLASRNAIISTLIILAFIYPIFSRISKWKYFAYIFLISLLSFLLIKNVKYLRDRFSIELVSDIKPLKDGSYINYSDTDPRIERWKAAVDLIRESPFLGHGTGDEVYKLKQQYLKRNLIISYLESFNAHNQYLSVLIKHGILGLALFLTAFITYLIIGIRQRYVIYVAFTVLLLIGFYTENILDANKGIVFFALMNTIFLYSCINSSEKLDKNMP